MTMTEDKTITEELSKLVTVCPHCGKKLLTVVGMFVQMDPDDPRWGLTEGLERACDCATAKRIAEDEKREEEAKEREAEERKLAKRARALFAESGMPERWMQDRGMRQWDRDGASRQVAYDDAVAFGAAIVAKKRPQSLYVVGDIGVGKTFLCSCLCTDLVRKGKRVVWRNMSEVLREIRACFDNKALKESEVIKSFVRPQVLVLDDLGKERPTEWAVEQLFAIVNARYDEGKALIVTTNYGSEELARRLTPRPDAHGYADDTTARAIVDRLRGVSKCVKLEGRSRR